MIKQLLEKELQRLLAWYATCSAFGVLYFFTVAKHNIYVLASLAFLSLLIVLLNKVKVTYVHVIGIGLLFFILGNISAFYREYSLDTYMIKEKLEYVWVEGDIERIEDNKKNKRIYLINLDGDVPEKLKKIRVTTKSKDPQLISGTRVRVLCTLMPPPQASVPGGFDMALFSYFKGIGAIGYTMSKPFIIESDLEVRSWIEELRSKIAVRIQHNIKKRNAAIASGLLVGDASEIDDTDFEAMRIAGTAHLIAISGMHIALIAGILFLTLKWPLTSIEFIAKRTNVKKYAAAIAIVGSYFYLLLAGSPVSAERAFVTSTIFLLAIIIDKQVEAIKSLSIAVILILSFRPEAILSPSLQMSVAACLGLIAGFSSSAYLYCLKRMTGSWIKKGLFYLFGVTFATLAAGAATSIFIAYHFKQFSSYSVLSNILAVPLNDFFIMPCGLIALILMPFGLEKWPLILMDWGIDGLLYISHYISSMPHASFYVPFFSINILFIMTIGLLVLCICQTYIRYLGLLAIILAVYSVLESKPPDLLLSSSGNIFGVVNKGDLMVSSKVRERYTQKIWQQTTGTSKVITLGKEGMCNQKFCFLQSGRFKILINKDIKSLSHSCHEVDLFINMTNNDFRCNEARLNINAKDFEKNGAYAIWNYGSMLRIKSVYGQDIVLN